MHRMDIYEDDDGSMSQNPYYNKQAETQPAIMDFDGNGGNGAQCKNA